MFKKRKNDPQTIVTSRSFWVGFSIYLRSGYSFGDIATKAKLCIKVYSMLNFEIKLDKNTQLKGNHMLG